MSRRGKERPQQAQRLQRVARRAGAWQRALGPSEVAAHSALAKTLPHPAVDTLQQMEGVPPTLRELNGRIA